MNQLLKYLYNGQFGEVFKVFILVARCICIFFGIMSLWGAAWFGLAFSSGADACGFLAAIIPATKSEQKKNRSKYILALSLAGLFFQIMDVLNYYWKLNIIENNYPWKFAIALFAALAIMALHGATTLPSKSQQGKNSNENRSNTAIETDAE